MDVKEDRALLEAAVSASIILPSTQRDRETEREREQSLAFSQANSAELVHT